MKRCKTKKSNFANLARRTLAGALSLSMIFSANIMTVIAATADADSPVKLGTVVDFGKAGVVLSTGNNAKLDGTMVTFGTTEAVSIEDIHGVKIPNPYAGNTDLTSETLGQALQRTGGSLNVFVYRTTANLYGYSDETNGPETDRFYVAPYESVEAAQEAASKGEVKIVENLNDLTYATREAAIQINATSEAASKFNRDDSSTYIDRTESAIDILGEDGVRVSRRVCYKISDTEWISEDKKNS